MIRHFAKRDVYSRAEKLSDAMVHVLGVLAAIVGASVLITLAVVWHTDISVLTAAIVYSACLLLMLTASALYHMTPSEDWKWLLQRLDHSAIYVKIAGTYTPFVALTGTNSLLAGLWGAALAGTSLKIFAPDRFVWVALALYILMGWAGVLAGGDLLSSLSPAALTLMFTGGAIYTLGVIFFLWEQLPFHTTIWHAMVLVATCIFYAAILIEIAGVRALA